MPWRLADVLGQEEILKRLQHERSRKRMAHAYMIEGPQGMGKTTLAHGLAAAMLCRQPPSEGDACGVCRSCHMLQTGNHPDYLELPREPAELRLGRLVERTAGNQETLDHQPLLPFLRLKPIEGGMRIALIPDAERMRPEAANAFLKTLEEPPGQTLLILTVGMRDRLLATITSRCRRVGINPLPPQIIAEELAKRVGLEGRDAEDLALAAEGSLGVALELGGGEVLPLWRWLEAEAFANPGAVAAQKLADAWLGSGVGGDNAGKRKGALAALDLTALVMRRKLRHGLDSQAGAKTLGVLWDAADQIFRNVSPELVLRSAAFEIMAVLRGSGA